MPAPEHRPDWKESKLIRGVLRAPGTADLLWQIVDGDDPVWAEDELIRRLLAALEAPDA